MVLNQIAIFGVCWLFYHKCYIFSVTKTNQLIEVYYLVCLKDCFCSTNTLLQSRKKTKKVLKEINSFVMSWSGVLLVVCKEYSFSSL